MTHFPEQFPLDALQILGPIVRSGGNVGDRVEAGEAAYTLLGWGLGAWLGTGQAAAPLAASFGDPPEDQVGLVGAEEALHGLETMASGRVRAGTQSAVGGVQVARWAIELARFVIPLLLRS